MSSSPGRPQKTCIPEFKSTVFTMTGGSSCPNVRSPTVRAMRCSSGSRLNRAGERMRWKAISACATANTSLRDRLSAISRSLAIPMPPAQAAPTSAPTLDPMMRAGRWPRSRNAWITPTRVNGGSRFKSVSACPGGSVPSNVVDMPMTAPLFLTRLGRDPWARFGLGLVAGLAVLALLAPWLAPGDPFRGDLAASLRPPSGAFLLGSDVQGRDVLSRVLYGARLSLAVGLISQSIALALGVTLGLVSGYYGRWMDGVIMRVVFVVIGIVGWAGMARIVRGQVLLARGLDYVQAARALGASDARIIARHLLPNVIAPVIVAATLGIGGAIMAEAALSFIGLGAQPPTPSWGAMVAEGRDLLRVAPWVSIAPGVAIGLTVLGLNLLGDGLRDALDVRGVGRVA